MSHLPLIKINSNQTAMRFMNKFSFHCTRENSVLARDDDSSNNDLLEIKTRENEKDNYANLMANDYLIHSGFTAKRVSDIFTDIDDIKFHKLAQLDISVENTRNIIITLQEQVARHSKSILLNQLTGSNGVDISELKEDLVYVQRDLDELHSIVGELQYKACSVVQEDLDLERINERIENSNISNMYFITDLQTQIHDLEKNQNQPLDISEIKNEIVHDIQERISGTLYQTRDDLSNQLEVLKRTIEDIQDISDDEESIDQEFEENINELVKGYFEPLEQETRGQINHLDNKVDNLENDVFNFKNEIHVVLDGIKNIKEQINYQADTNEDKLKNLDNKFVEKMLDFEYELKEKINETDAYSRDQIFYLEKENSEQDSKIEELEHKLLNNRNIIDNVEKDFTDQILEHCTRIHDLEEKLSNNGCLVLKYESKLSSLELLVKELESKFDNSVTSINSDLNDMKELSSKMVFYCDE
jgi:hypothetical protein